MSRWQSEGTCIKSRGLNNFEYYLDPLFSIVPQIATIKDDKGSIKRGCPGILVVPYDTGRHAPEGSINWFTGLGFREALI